MSVSPNGVVVFLAVVVGDSPVGAPASERSRRADAAVRAAVGAHGVLHRADSIRFAATFDDPRHAVAAAVALVRDAADGLAVALHAGDASIDGTTMDEADHLAAAAHAGQAVVSTEALALARAVLPPDVTVRDIGTLRLRTRPEAEHVYQLVVAGVPADFPPPKVAARRRTNLPVLATPFFGRGDEVREGCRLLRQPLPRLLTLTGAGGVGKTRLGIEIATALADDFAHGVFWVPLAAVGDAAGVVPAIARVLGVAESGTTALLDLVTEFVREREVLLVLDNFEQVVDAAPVLDDLLQAAPHLRLLVTSRAILRVAGEHELAVLPLPLPAQRPRGPLVDERQPPTLEHLLAYPAVALFVARAQVARPDWVLTAPNATTVAAICARLDGLPLAIELAAARMRLLAPQELLARLERRLQILTGGARSLLPHQQTLRSTIAWSYDLLPEPERRLFARLAVFAGGWTIAAAETVCEDSIDVLDGLGRLLDESLIQHERARRDGAETRLLMLDTIREYALERLQEQGELAALRQRHAAYFAARADDGRAHLTQGAAEQTAHLERWDADDDNVRAALLWSREADDRLTLARLAGSLWRYWELRGRFSEGRAWLEQALGKANAVVPDDPIVARVLDGAGVLADYQGDYGRAEALYRQSLAAWERIGDERGVARALNGLGGMAAVRGDWSEAREHYERSLRLRRALGDRSDEATTLNNLALVAFDQQQFVQAQQFFEQSLQIARAIGDERGVARGLANVGLAAMYRGDQAEAEQLLEASLAMYRAFGEPSGIAHLLSNLGNVALANRDDDRARTLYVESLALFHSIEDRNGIAESLDGLARAATGRGHLDRAVRLWAAADALRAAIDAPRPTADREVYDQSIATARAGLDERRFDLAWQDGTASLLATTIDYASAPPPPSPVVAPSLPTPPAPETPTEPKPVPAGLSEREIDVLRLVARGMSAKEVAAQLIISPRTVHAHLASIYGKIGVSTRVAATHFAIEHGII